MVQSKSEQAHVKKNYPAIGQNAPDFEVAKSGGDTFRLSEVLKSGKNIKLVFYRGHW